MEELTRSEEEIMRILWELGEGVVHDILDKIPEPKPPYTTVSSVVRVLEKKGYVQHRAYGKTHLYFPRIAKQEYARQSFKTMVQHYFEGSPQKVVSFLVQEQELGSADMAELRQLIDSYATSKKNHE
jgi:predicted transcriptional regulator